MKPEKAIEILRKKMYDELAELQTDFSAFRWAILNNELDRAGEYAPKILRLMIKFHVRLGTIAALEEID